MDRPDFLQPWFANLGKRQVKAPKVYFRDPGILHALLNLPDPAALRGHPAVGASWEGFALEQVIQLSRADAPECHFWANACSPAPSRRRRVACCCSAPGRSASRRCSPRCGPTSPSTSRAPPRSATT